MKKAWWLLLLAVILALGLYWYYWPGSRRAKQIAGQELAEQIRIKTLHITKVDLAGSNLVAKGLIVLDKDFAGPLEVGKIDTKLLLDGTLPVKATSRLIGGSDSIAFIGTLPALEFLRTARRLQKKDSLWIRLVTHIPVKIPLVGWRTFDLLDSLRVRNYKLPKIEMGKPEMKLKGLKRVLLTIPVHVENLDDYRFALEDINIRITGPKGIDVKIKDKTRMEFGPRAKHDIILKGDASIDKPLDILGDVLRNNDQYDFATKGQVLLEFVQDGKPLRLPIQLDDKQVIELRPDKKGREERKDLAKTVIRK